MPTDFVVKNGSKMWRQRVRVHAAPVVGDRRAERTRRGKRRACEAQSSSSTSARWRSSTVSLPTSGDRVAGVHAKVREDLIDLARIDLHGPDILLEHPVDLHILPDESLQHLEHALNALVEIEHSGRGGLLPRKRQQLPREVCGASGGIDDRSEVQPQRVRLDHVVRRQIGVAENHGQHVVEVVGDAPCQAAHRLHLLRLLKLRFEFRFLQLDEFAVGHVQDDAVPQRAAIARPLGLCLTPTPAQSLSREHHFEFAEERRECSSRLRNRRGHAVVVLRVEPTEDRRRVLSHLFRSHFVDAAHPWTRIGKRRAPVRVEPILVDDTGHDLGKVHQEVLALLQRRLGELAMGDVVLHRDVVRDLTVGVSDAGDGGGLPEQFTVLAAVAQLSVPLTACRDRRPHVVVDLGGHRPRLEDSRVLAAHFILREAGGPLEVGVHILDGAAAVRDDDGERALFHQRVRARAFRPRPACGR